MPIYNVEMHDFVRIDASVIVEAHTPEEAAAKAKALWEEDASEVSAENSWESWDQGVQIDEAKKIEDDSRFFVLPPELFDEQNNLDISRSCSEGELFAIVDEQKGIIAYAIGQDHASLIAGVLEKEQQDAQIDQIKEVE